MAALDNIAAEAREGVARVGEADLVVALPSCHNGELLAAAAGALGPILSSWLPDRKCVLLYPASHPDAAPSAASEKNPEKSSEKDAAQAADSPVHLLPYPLPAVELLRDQSLDQGLRSLMQVGKALNARAFVMLASTLFSGLPSGTLDSDAADLETSGPKAAAALAEDLQALAQPVLDHGYDLAIPIYARRKFASLINSSIVYPLTRALYGTRLHFPMAMDLALSARLAELELHPASSAKEAPAGWVAMRAISAGLQVCQVHRDAPLTPAGSESPDVSAVLAQVLNRLFMEIDRTAGFWQRVRGSQPVRTFGNARQADSESDGESASVDVQPMVETFQRGCRDLLDIWAPMLSPGTLVELRRIAKLPVNQFRLEDELWAHVLYDFILGYRQRVISREHLLRALTPIYLGWVASYALEVQNLPPGAVEERQEKICASFEKLKPYLLSRWRWPDRFNP